jgi:hypothetical protein
MEGAEGIELVCWRSCWVSSTSELKAAAVSFYCFIIFSLDLKIV